MFEHSGLIGVGECFEVREFLKPAIEVGQDCFHLRLLEHELRDYCFVEARVLSPG